MRGCSLFACTQINHNYDWHAGGWCCLGDTKIQNALHSLANREAMHAASIHSSCSGLNHIPTFLPRIFYAHFHTPSALSYLSQCYCLPPCSPRWPVSIFHYHRLNSPPQTPKLSPLFNSSIPTLQSPVHSFSLFHRFNRMHLGHTSILCNLYHLCAKLRQSERLMARQTNTNIHTRCTWRSRLCQCCNQGNMSKQQPLSDLDWLHLSAFNK